MTELEQLHTENEQLRARIALAQEQSEEVQRDWLTPLEAQALKDKLARVTAALRAVQPYATYWHYKIEETLLRPYDGNQPLPPEYSKAALALYNYYRDERIKLEALMKEALDQ